MPSTFNYSDVMISYSRKDKPFIRQLDEALRKAGREVWIDWEDIPPTADWWKEIQAGIEAANTVIFVITPNSIVSSICKDELEHAVKHNKRIIPILLQDITDPQVKAQMHQALQQHNWVMFRQEDNFDTAFSTLVKALETDLVHVGVHTKLLVRAREWDGNQRKNGFLLRGDDLREAERWLAKGLSHDPTPTPLQAEYIQSSRKAATRLRQVAAGAMLVALVILSFLTARVFAESQNTQVALATANSALLLAEQRDQSRATAAANAIEQADLHATAAQDALNQNATAQIAQGMAQHEADNAATQAQAAQNNAATATVARGQAQIEAGNARQQASIAQQRATEAQSNANQANANATEAQSNANQANANATESQSNANAAQTQEAIANANAEAAQTQEAIAIAKGKEAAEKAREAQALQLADSSSQALAAGDRQLALTLALAAYNLDSTSDQVQSALLAANYAPGLARRFEVPLSVVSATVVFSDADKQVLLLPTGGTPMAWDVQTGMSVTPVSTPNTPVVDNRIIKAVSTVVGNKIELNVPVFGNIITVETTYDLNHAGIPSAQSFSGNGKLFISGDDAGLIYLWDVVTGVELYRFSGHTGKILSLAFNSTNSAIISYASDRTIRVWEITALSATVDNTDKGNNGARAFFALSPNGEYGLSWDYSGGFGQTGKNITDRIISWKFGTSNAVWDNSSVDNPYTFGAFSPDSTLIVYANQKQIFLHRISDADKIENTEHDPVLVRQCETPASPPIAFSSDSKLLMVADCKTVSVYDTNNVSFTESTRSYTAQSNISQVYFSEDNNSVFLVLDDGTLLNRNALDLSEDVQTDPLYIIPGIPMITISASEVISGETSGSVRLWNPTANVTTRTFLGQSQRITDMAVSDDKSLLAAIAADRKIIIWQYETGQIIFSLTVNETISNLHFAKIDNQLRLYGFSSSKGVLSRLFYWVIPDLVVVGDDALNAIATNICNQNLVSSLSDAQLEQLNLGGEQRDVCNLLKQRSDAQDNPIVVTATPGSSAPGSTIEAESASVRQTGVWEARNDVAASAGQYLVNTNSDSSSTLSFVFEGTGIDVLYGRDTAFGTFTAQIDSGAMQASSRSALEAIQFDGRITFDDLPAGQHTLTIIPLASQIAIDGFVVHTAPTAEMTVEATAEVTAEIVAEVAAQAVVPLDNMGWSGDVNWSLIEQGWFVSTGMPFNLLTLNDPVNMTDNQPRQLQFQSLLTVEDIGGSIAAVQASTDNQNWTLLNTVMPTDIWNHEIIDLSPFSGQLVYLRLVWYFVPPLEGQDADLWIVDDLKVEITSPIATILPPTPTSLPTATLTLQPTLTEVPTNEPAPTITLEIATAVLLPEAATATEIPSLAFAAPVALPVSDNLNSGASDWYVEGGWQLDEIGIGDFGWYALGTDGILVWRKPLDLSATQSPLLTFDSLLTAQTASATVQISVDSFNWTPAFTVAAQDVYQQTVIDLSGYVGQIIYVRFVWQNQNEADAFWFIDNLLVEDTGLTAIPSEPAFTQEADGSVSVTEEMPIASVTETLEAVFTETSLPTVEAIVETVTAAESSTDQSP